MKHAALSFALLVAALGIVPQILHAQKKAGELKLEPRVFDGPNGAKVEGFRGTLTVRENRNNPNSRLIDLVFAKFNTTSKNPGPPIIYLAGGPGGSGIAAARGPRFPLFMAMREIGDVIALDQRGTGTSVPSVACRETFTYPIDQPFVYEKAFELLRAASHSCAESLKAEGADLAGYNTNENSDDIEDLRKALGAPKISLWGISYGTHLAINTIRRHEKSIHRVILAGVEGPQHTIKLPSDIEKHFVNLDRLAKAEPELSIKVPSLTALMKQVLDEVDKKPAVVEVTDPRTNQPVKVTINKEALQLLIAFRLGTDEPLFPAAFYALSKGDFSRAAQGWVRLVSGTQTIGSGMSNMMDCFSGISPARSKRVAAEAKTTLLGNALNYPFPEICSAWGNPDLGEDFRKNIKTDAPTLFISGTLDVRTPPSNADEVRKGFKNNYHLIIDGAVHSDPLFLSSPKILETMLQFMRGEKPTTLSITLDPIKFQQIAK